MKGLILISALPGATLTLLFLNLIKGNWPEVWLALPWAAALNPVFFSIFWLMHRNEERDYTEGKNYLALGYLAGVGMGLYMHFGLGAGIDRLMHGPRIEPN